MGWSDGGSSCAVTSPSDSSASDSPAGPASDWAEGDGAALAGVWTCAGRGAEADSGARAGAWPSGCGLARSAGRVCCLTWI